MKARLLLSIAALLSGGLCMAQRSYNLILEGRADRHGETILLTEEDRYTQEKGYGFDLMASPKLHNKAAKSPYYISVYEPDGNYKVTVTVGNSLRAGNTTVRAESRRLFLENIVTRKGEQKTYSFIVNKRNTVINEKEKVLIKEREKNKLNWDDKLTIEINGDAPAISSIRIEPADENVPTVYLCGNSTVVDQDYEPWASWGQMIPRFFDENVAFANYAESGETAETFIQVKRLKKILTTLKAGDYIVMEFGHNDQKQKKPGSGAYYNFATALKTFIDEARKVGATPILVTPTQRRFFKDGKIQETHANYPEAMAWVAEREEVQLIDLHSMTRTLFETLGEEGSKRAFVHYPAGSYPGQTQAFADNTHFNPYGAYEIAKCIIEGMKELKLPIVEHLRSDYKTYNPAQPDDRDAFHWNDSPFTDTLKPDGN